MLYIQLIFHHHLWDPLLYETSAGSRWSILILQLLCCMVSQRPLSTVHAWQLGRWHLPSGQSVHGQALIEYRHSPSCHWMDTGHLIGTCGLPHPDLLIPCGPWSECMQYCTVHTACQLGMQLHPRQIQGSPGSPRPGPALSSDGQWCPVCN